MSDAAGGPAPPAGGPTRAARVLMLLLLPLIPTAADAQDPGPIAMVRLDASTPAQREYLSSLGHEVHGDLFGSPLVLFVDPPEMQRLRAAGFDPVVIERDAPAYFRSRLEPGFGPGSMGGYYTLAEAEAAMDRLAMRYPAIVSPKTSAGTSLEGRDIWVFRMSDDPSISDPARPAVFYNSLIHAREPISMMVVLAFAEDLARKYSEGDPQAAYLLASREVWFMPVVNPDGYYYNETIAPEGGGLWRKNKRDNDGNGFFNEREDGVDLNRNFGYQWGNDNSGSSPNRRSETYRGLEAFSEPETGVVRDVVLGVGLTAPPDWSFILNYHAYANVYIYPWGYDPDRIVGRLADFRSWASLMGSVNHFPYGTGVETIGYHTNGDAVDWQYGSEGIMSMVPEVGNLFDYFWPPSIRIPVIVEEQLGANWMTLWMAGGVLLPGPLQVFESTGDSDGIADAGETVEVGLIWRNAGFERSVTGASATLTSLSPAGNVVDGTVQLGDFQPRESRLQLPRFVIQIGDAPGARRLPFELRVTGDGGYVRADTVGIVVGGADVLLSEGFEQGLGRWETGGFFQRSQDAAASGVWGVTDGPGGTVIAEVNWLDLLDPVDLSRYQGGRLTFQSRRGVGPRNAALVTLAGHPGPWPGADPPLAPDPLVYYASADGPGWEQIEIDLTPYAGTPQLWFRWASLYRVNPGSGWALDSVRIEAWTDTSPITALAAGRILLSAPYPNPANPSSAGGIRMSVDLSDLSAGLLYATFRVYDVRGRLIAAPFEGSLQSLNYPDFFRWDGRTREGRLAASGIYLLRVDAGGRTATRKVVILR